VERLLPRCGSIRRSLRKTEKLIDGVEEIDIMEKPWLDDRVQHAQHWDGCRNQQRAREITKDELRELHYPLVVLLILFRG
jgi:hypothetical protein